MKRKMIATSRTPAYSLAWASEGGQEALAPLDFENFTKKGCFLSFEWGKQISPLLAPPGEILEKSPGAPPWKKSFRRPCSLVAAFSSSPANFSRALHIFEKCFFTTLAPAPLALHRVSVMRLTL